MLSFPHTAGREHDRSHFVVPPTFGRARCKKGQAPPLLSQLAAEGPAAGVSAPAPALSSPAQVRIGLLQPREAFLCPGGRGTPSPSWRRADIQLLAIIVRRRPKSQGSGALMVQFVLGIDDIPPVHIAPVHTQHQHLGGSYVGGKGDIVLVAQTGDVEQLLVHGGIIGIYKK